MFRKFPKKALARRPKRPPGEMNKTEAKYAAHLQFLMHAGQIHDYRYEPVKLLLAKKSDETGAMYFIPDFMVVGRDMTITFAEVKGATKNKKTGQKTFWCEEDAKLKIKMAADLFPWFAFAIVWLEGNAWRSKEFSDPAESGVDNLPDGG